MSGRALLPTGVGGSGIVFEPRGAHTLEEIPDEGEILAVAVVPMPSRTHRQRVRSVAEHLATVGKLSLLDVLEVAGSPVAPDLASARRADRLFEQITVRTDAGVPDGPILLVDDTYRSGCTMTVVGALLRESGASAVRPLVVHRLV